MNGTLPEKNYYTDSYDAKWSWPSHKFQLKPDALFTTLHERFNTRNCPIQDPYAFLLDVRLCANESNNVDDFYARLAAQKAKRVLELEEIWDNVTDLMAFDEKGLPSDRIWTCKQCKNSGISDVNTPCEPMSTNDTPELHSKSFFNMIQTMSFDSMVKFFDGFVREARKERDEYYREKRARMQRGREEGARRRAAKQNQELQDQKRAGEGSTATAGPQDKAAGPELDVSIPAGAIVPSPSVPTRNVANDPPPLSQPPSTPSSDAETSFDQSPATTPSPRKAQFDSKTGKRNICTAFNSITAKTANSPHTTIKHTKRGRAASEQSCEDEIIATGEASPRQPRKTRRRVSLQTESDIPAGNVQIRTSAAGTSEATCGVLSEADIFAAATMDASRKPHGLMGDDGSSNLDKTNASPGTETSTKLRHSEKSPTSDIVQQPLPLGLQDQTQPLSPSLENDEWPYVPIVESQWPFD
ncbi:hypothetical protein MCOR28_003589 [Pyricularia oryzae]|nr:hypothetical protein MCOR26_000409 [Pyricularia oryzae]KAI6345385.1 hypothetical protein MCOR28_003589 [Pyricularia oryzae]KAI6565380.1 hypothetical protein MCOR09_006820 [Pyricularia oryzae]